MALKQIFFKQSGDFWIYGRENCHDLKDLNIVKNKEGATYLEGKVTFTDLDFDFLLGRRKNNVLTLDFSYGNPNLEESYQGVLSLTGAWNYKQRTCTLNVKPFSVYEQFEKIIGAEKTIGRDYDTVFYEFDSYTDTKYCSSEIVDSVYPDYTPDTADNFPTWDAGKAYVPSQVEPDGEGGYYYYGDDRSFVTYTSGGSTRKFVCLVANTGEPPTNPTYWLDITISTVLVYKQERAAFEFDGAEFEEYEKYWYKSSKTTDTYDRVVPGYKVEDMINLLLEDTDFTLADNWLTHAQFVNERYSGLYIVNTEIIDKLALENIFEVLRLLFRVEYRLEGHELTFRHWSQLNMEFKGARPAEHNFQNRADDIVDYAGGDLKEIFEHRLIFSRSYNDTHEDSVLTYDNDFLNSNKVKSNFEVDFVYAMNKGGLDCPVTVDGSGKVYRIGDLYNPDFIPSTIHEEFYFDGREFESAEFNGVPVSLSLDYSEEVNFEAPPSLKLNNFLPNFDVLLPAGKGMFKKIEFNMVENKYKLTCALRKPINFY